MKVSRDIHRRYLRRTAQRLRRATGRAVTEQEVLEALLDLAIADEGTYDPQDGRVVSAERRAIMQAEKAARTQTFTAEDLLTLLAADEPT
jgi:hypothetical protein